ncbi:hypothetical protein C7N83_07570 [Neisseria iguanae]|uniref:Uncharacterized protein n=1 Tax=Neisseria iguanae TaxID=90242 RepID=A0A2P7TZR9_9NEIS|nr:hypothetical protein C7N83_07570 [Neisseria iguanae]
MRHIFGIKHTYCVENAREVPSLAAPAGFTGAACKTVLFEYRFAYAFFCSKMCAADEMGTQLSLYAAKGRLKHNVQTAFFYAKPFIYFLTKK